MQNKVIWNEGLFLTPQHFQQQERYFEALIHEKTAGLNNHSWGLKSIKINNEQLALSKIVIDEAEGIFPDGTFFNIPDHDQSPETLTIDPKTKNTIVYLALPILKQGEAETRFFIDNQTLINTINPEIEPSDIELGKVYPQLKLASDNINDYHAIPIARINECQADGSILLDDAFIPAALTVNAHRSLHQLPHEILALLNHRSHALSQRLTDVEQSATAEITDFMLLQLVNRYEAEFYDLTQDSQLHPHKLYQSLIPLLAELSTYTNDKRRAERPSSYDHHDLTSTFEEIATALRHALSIVLVQSAVAIPLESRDAGIWVGSLKDNSLLNECDFVLAVSADVPAEQLRKSLPAQIKIAPVEQIHHLVMRSLPGIEIENLPIAPRQIPYHSNHLYFHISKQSEYWNALMQSAGIAIHLSGLYPGLKLELWAVRG